MYLELIEYVFYDVSLKYIFTDNYKQCNPILVSIIILSTEYIYHLVMVFYRLYLLSSFLSAFTLCCSYLTLVLLKLGEGYDEVLFHILLSEELNGPLVDPPRTLDVVMFLLKPSISDRKCVISIAYP